MINLRLSIAVLLVLLASAAGAISAADAPLLNRAQLTAVEQGVDSRMQKLWNDNSLSLVGQTRAAYLPGYGLVLSADVNLATVPRASLMGEALTDKEMAEIRKKKTDRLPVLRSAMKEIMANLATSLNKIPATEQIAFVVVLPRSIVEESWGLPVQVIMQATRQDLLESQPAVRVTESN